MNREAWAKAEVLINKISMGEWDTCVSDLAYSLPQWVREGHCSEAEADAINAALEARHDRHRRAHQRHQKVEDARRTIGGLVGALVPQYEPKAKPEPVLALCPKRRRNYTLAERLDRYRVRLRSHWHRYWQALTPLPGQIIDFFTAAEAGALRWVLRDAHQHGKATRPLKFYAASAKCCRKTVQSAIRSAVAIGLLSITDVPGKASEIRVVNQEAVRWADRSLAYLRAGAPLPEREKTCSYEEDEETPVTLERGLQSVTEPARGQPQIGPLDAFLNVTLRDFELSDRRRRESGL